VRILAIILGACLPAFCGCASAPDAVYQGPAGRGQLEYVPGVGITRRGALIDGAEQGRFDAMRQAFDERRWQDCIELSRELTAAAPDGARAVDALLMRIQARMETSRGDDDPLARALLLSQWMFVYLAPEYDPRLRQLMDASAEARDNTRAVRELEPGRFIGAIRPSALAALRNGQLYAAQAECRVLLTYYLPALELREYRAPVLEACRNVLWLLFAAANYNRAIEAADELLSVNPAPAVKADALFIQAQSMRANDAHHVAARTFGLLFRGAGLRDTDTRWRPYALMLEVEQTLRTSKGYIYDLTVYEMALDLLEEYGLYRIENQNVPAAVHADMLTMLNDTFDVLVRRDRDAADTYRRLGRRGARDYYLARMDHWEEQRRRRLTDLTAEEQGP
jgi:tetratricopeptide (TPR) repeat protein